MGHATGFHGNNARWQLRKKLQKPEALNMSAQDDRTRAVDRRQAADRLDQVNSKNRDINRNAPSCPTDTCNNSCCWVGRQVIPLAHEYEAQHNDTA